MRIGLDARDALRRESGISAVTSFLIRGLAELDTGDDFLLYLDEYDGPRPTESGLPNAPGFRQRVLSGHGQIWKQARLPAALKRDRIDVFHSMTSTIPFRRPCPTVVTICDLFFEVYPEFVPLKSRLEMKLLFTYAARRADKIIAISENTKADIVRFFGVPEQKIIVSYPGLNPFFKRLDDDEGIRTVLKNYHIDAPYILHVGSLSFTRNIEGLAAAFARLSKDHPEVNLVLIGHPFWGFDLDKIIDEHGLRNNVVAVNYMPNDHLRAVYNAAEALVLPSFFEGFGLPIIEAMACGTPVVASNAGAMKEAAGDAGLLVDPRNIDEMAGALRKILEDVTLRRSLADKGYVQAAKFTWSRAAEQAYEVYRSFA